MMLIRRIGESRALLRSCQHMEKQGLPLQRTLATFAPAFPFKSQYAAGELSTSGQQYPVVFGSKSAADELKAVAQRSGIDKMLVVRDNDAGAAKRAQYAEFLLLQAGIPCFQYTLKGDCARLDTIDEAVANAQRVGATGALAFGGGNAADMARAVAFIMANGGNASEYGKHFDTTDAEAPAPHIIMPTISGAGAEISTQALVLDEDAESKHSFVSLPLTAEAVIIDPLLAISVPLQQTVQGALNALVQCIESYLYGCEDEQTNELSLEGVRIIASAFAKPLVEGKIDLKNVVMREQLAMGSLLGGVCANSSGYGAAHSLAVSLGGISDIPHAQITSSFAPFVMDRYAELARENGGDEFFDDMSEKLAIVQEKLTSASGFDGDSVATWLRYVSRRFNLPTTSALELEDSHVNGVVERAVFRLQETMATKSDEPILEKEDIQTILDNAAVVTQSDPEKSES